jgi:hypothetical protein
MLTWIHDRFRPQVLHAKPVHFPIHVLVDETITVPIYVVFRLNIAIINTVSKLDVLQHILHHLL